MRYFRVEHKNYFREWVIAHNEKEAVNYLKRNRFHGENFSYDHVTVVEALYEDLVSREDQEEWPFEVNEISFERWAASLSKPVYMGNSSDTWGNWEESFFLGERKVEVKCSSGILEDDQEAVCLLWEYRKAQQDNLALLAVCSSFPHAKELIKQRVSSHTQSDCSIELPYGYLLNVIVLNELVL